MQFIIMILKEEHLIFTYVKQKCTIFFIPFRAKQAMIEYYVNIIYLKKRGKGLQYRNCLHLYKSFWTLNQVRLVEVRRSSSQCLHMLEMPAQLQEHLNSLLL